MLSLGAVGMTAPITPYLVAEHVADPAAQAWHTSALYTIYNLCAFLALPTLGALSDRRGRKPVLCWCLLGSALGYFYFGWTSWLGGLYLSRLIDGLTGGTFAVIYASVADRVPPQERVRFFGWLGAAAGMGFVVGPGLGTLISHFVGAPGPPLLAGALCLINLLWCMARYEETLDQREQSPMSWREMNPVSAFLGLDLPHVRRLLLASFLYMVPFAALQSNSNLLNKQYLGWDATRASALFLLIGVVGVIMQGGVLPRLRRMGEGRLLAIGTAGMSLAFVLVAVAFYARSTPLMFASAGVFAAGNALFAPTLTKTISGLAGGEAQGRLQGANQSAQSLARVVGPLLASWLYASVSPASPYEWGAGLFVVAWWLTRIQASFRP